MVTVFTFLLRWLLWVVARTEANTMIHQVVLAKTLRNPNGIASKITKILMQMDVKAGGKLWRVNLPTKNTMFVGIDTNHDIVRKRSSVGGFVASMDQDLTRSKVLKYSEFKLLTD